MINETQSYGTTGLLCFHHDKYFFRVYSNQDKFIDYEIRPEEIKIKLTGEEFSFYHNNMTNEYYLDFSTKALDKNND